MKWINRAFCLLSISLLTIGIFGCNSEKKSAFSHARPKTSFRGTSREQVVRVNIASEPQTLDPRKVRSLNDVNVSKMIMEGLTRSDKNGKVSLALAKKMNMSEDQKTYTFTLREAKWSNGDPITSYDFANAWKKSLSPTFNSPFADMLYIIKNGKEAKKGELPISLIGVETPDEQTLIVHLDHPVPYFLDLLSVPIFFPVNSRIDQLDAHWAEGDMAFVSNGPFKMEKWNHQDSILVAKNENYWDAETVQLSQVKMVMVSEDTGFKMFATKELDWDGSPFSSIPIDAMQSLKQENKLHTAPTLGTHWIRVNTTVFPFESSKMRKAFAYAIKRHEIVEHVAQGNQIPATGIVPQAMGLQDAPYFNDGDIETASQLFEEALSEMGYSREDLPPITLTYASGDRPQAICQAIQQQWREAFGIEVRLETVERKVFFDRINKQDYTLSLGSWFADFNDPINFLEVFKTKSTGTNNTLWGNPHYTELLEASNQCPNPQERKKLLQQSEKIILDEMPVIPIFYSTMLYVKDQKLEDVVLTAMGEIDFKWAHLKE